MECDFNNATAEPSYLQIPCITRPHLGLACALMRTQVSHNCALKTSSEFTFRSSKAEAHSQAAWRVVHTRLLNGTYCDCAACSCVVPHEFL